MQTSAFHREYFHGLGWFMDLNGNWYARDCSDEYVDNNARCVKCSSAFNNINKTYYPKLFEPSPIPTLLPNVTAIDKIVFQRLGCINDSFEEDATLTKAAGLLRLNGCDRIDVGNSKVFVVCEKCP